jgi:hypothetical protein
MNLGRIQVLSPEAHGVLDYITGVTLLAAPNLFRFDKLRGPAVLTARLAGIMVLMQAALTDYKLGLIKLIPLRTHLTIDMLSGPFLAMSPFLFGFSRRRQRAWMPHVVAGMGELFSAVLTRPTTALEAEEERLTRAMERALEPARERGAAEWEATRRRMPAGTGAD